MLRLFTKATTYTVDHLAGIAEYIRYGTSTGKTISEWKALDVGAVYACAKIIAEDVAKMPVRVLSETYDAGGVRRTTTARGNWAHKLLAIRPNSWQTAYEFWEGMIFSAVLGNGGLAVIVRDGQGQPRELLPIPIGSWTVEQMPDYELRYRVDYADKTHGYFRAKDVFVIRGPGLDGFQALPAVKQAREAIGLSLSLEQQQATLADNSGRPSGVLSFDNPVKPETQEKIRNTYKSKFGPGGSGGLMILDGGAKFHNMTMSMVDSQYIESRRLQIEEICRFFRVHPTKVMQYDKAATFASQEQHSRAHVSDTLMPWVRRSEQAAQRDILGFSTTHRVDFDERALLRGDHKDQAQYYTQALGAGGQPGWMTVNEIRCERDMNPIEEDWANTVPQGAMNPSEAAAGATSPNQEET